MKQHIQTIFTVALIFLSASLFSQTSDELIKNFIKGNIEEKIQLVNAVEEVESSYNNLWEVALDFINRNYPILSDDTDFIALARVIVQKSGESDFQMFLPQLKNLFETVDNAAIKLDLLTFFSSISVDNDEIIILINDYAQSLLLKADENDENILYLTLEILGNFSSSSSFPVLFQAYSTSENEQIVNVAFSSLINLNSGYENYVRDLIENGTSREKYFTLRIVQNNSKNSDFFKAEMSEKALSDTIISIGDVSVVDTYTIELQMTAIRELVRISWTRSADLITEFYLVAKKEFEAGVLNEENFSEIIYAFTALSSGNAGMHLAEYLEELNKQQEENSAYSESIVLTVIQSLGQLGDKVAFDALLYTTYLEYPENIILAARDALVTLKW